MSTAVLHGITIGTRIGTGLNDTNVISSPSITDGVWYSQGGAEPIIYEPSIVDYNYNPPIPRTKFSQPIVGLTPVVLDNCAETLTIELTLRDETNQNVTVGQKWIPDTTYIRFLSSPIL